MADAVYPRRSPRGPSQDGRHLGRVCQAVADQPLEPGRPARFAGRLAKERAFESHPRPYFGAEIERQVQAFETGAEPRELGQLVGLRTDQGLQVGEGSGDVREAADFEPQGWARPGTEGEGVEHAGTRRQRDHGVFDLAPLGRFEGPVEQGGQQSRAQPVSGCGGLETGTNDGRRHRRGFARQIELEPQPGGRREGAAAVGPAVQEAMHASGQRHGKEVSCFLDRGHLHGEIDLGTLSEANLENLLAGGRQVDG